MSSVDRLRDSDFERVSRAKRASQGAGGAQACSWAPQSLPTITIPDRSTFSLGESFNPNKQLPN
jgi:hypothetical protein